MHDEHPRLALLKITDFAKTGHGSSRWVQPDGLEVEVEIPFSAAGDEALVEIQKKQKRLYQGKVIKWEKLSEDRTNPLCQHFGQCGGCRWQHLNYHKQLQQKETWIHQSLEPYLAPDVIRYPIIPCSPPWNYRNKMEFSFSSDKAGKRFLGLMLYGTNGHVLQLKECYLTNPWVLETVHCVSKWWESSGLQAYHGRKNTGSLRTLTVREGQRTGDRLVMLTVSGNPDYALSRHHLETLTSSLIAAIEPQSLEKKLSIFLRIQQITKGKPTQFYEMLLYGPSHLRENIDLNWGNGKSDFLQFLISPTAFFQPNTIQAEKLYSRAIELTEPSIDDCVYDLYCGTGTLGICIAKKVKEIVGIELASQSVLDARENAKKNNLANITIHQGDVAQVLTRIQEGSLTKPNVVMVDPPRAGLSPDAIEQILSIKASKLTYISCNPFSQAANLKDLIQGGYRLKAIQPVDQFPHTVHVENIAILTR